MFQQKPFFLCKIENLIFMNFYDIRVHKLFLSRNQKVSLLIHDIYLNIVSIT